MMHKAWSSIEEVPYCFARSSVQFQGSTVLKIVEFDPDWAFPDCNSSLNSPMAMKCCTKLEAAKERCPIVFQGHPANFKVTRDKTSLILTQIGRFRILGRSQLSNPSDLPCFILPLLWNYPCAVEMNGTAISQFHGCLALLEFFSLNIRMVENKLLVVSTLGKGIPFHNITLKVVDCFNLTHWGWDKMAANFLMTFSNAFSWMKIYEFQLQVCGSLFLRVQLTVFQHWFR